MRAEVYERIEKSRRSQHWLVIQQGLGTVSSVDILLAGGGW